MYTDDPLQELIDMGWSKDEAPEFLAWINVVQETFFRKVGLHLEELVGDWPSADLYTGIHDVEETVDFLIDFASNECMQDIRGMFLGFP